MTNLTEQLKKGELPDNHHYYFKLPKSKEYEVGNTFCLETLHYCKDGDKIEVLSEVPSYEEYQKLLSDQLAKNEGAEINAELNERLKKTQKLELDLRRENRKLKELLKDCKPFVELCNYTPENKRLLEQIVEQIGDK